jgi:hypothetical protein
MKQKSLIEEADQRVPIVLVCTLIKMDLEDGLEGRSVKTYCPFGRFFHSDGGVEPAFRIYPDSNSAYCFSCRKYFTPTTLASDAWDIPKKEAAKDLLDRVGYKTLTDEEIWAGVQEQPPEPDKSVLGLALRVYCQRVDPSWQASQFVPEVSTVLDKCLSLLDRVTNDQEAEQWLEVCKKVMLRTINQRINT